MLKIENETKRLPDFICIGPLKTATTWLYHSLRKHPEVEMPIKKECRYFKWKQINYEEYCNIFSSIPKDKKTGDLTPEYFLADPQEILNTIPKVKVFCILRNPVDRVISHYKMYMQERIFPATMSFTEAFENNIADIKEFGLYYKHIRNYLNFFDLNKNFKIFYYDDLIRHPKGFVYSICEYLEIKKWYIKFLNSDPKAYSHLAIPISFEEIKMAKKFYTKPNEKLFKLTGKEMNW